MKLYLKSEFPHLLTKALEKLKKSAITVCEVLFIFSIAIILMLVIIFGLSRLFFGPTGNFISINRENIWIMDLAVIVAFIVFPVMWERFIHKINLKEIGFNIPTNFLKELLYGLLAIIIILIAKYTQFNFLNHGKILININKILSGISFFSIINFLFVALGEETFCRGVIQRKLVNTFGAAGGIILASLIFAFLLHSTAQVKFIDNLMYRFPVGLILGYFYYKEKSLTVPIIMHFFINLL